MDLIKMTSITAYETELSQGEAINGYDSAIWIERFQEPGEFKITAKLSSGLREFLPIGTFISHLRTSELMWVENHEIKDPKATDSTIEISGRSFVCYLENRIVAQNHAAAANTIYEYVINSAPTWEQIEYLIYDHLVDVITVDFDDSLPGIYVDHSCTGTGTSEERIIKYGTIWDRVKELLKIDDIGIKMVRPTPTEPDIFFMIYQGADKSSQVRFSSFIGDLDNVEYFFSSRKIKNIARVVGKWVQVVATIDGSPPNNLDRRYMLLDASDIDNQQPSMPTGLGLDWITAGMHIRGATALRAQKDIVITQADVSPNARWRYGKDFDYNLGDLVMIDANFGDQIMRVVEHAEVEDENGTSAHPTLAIPGEA
jgi:Siphovirus ReqiPepy6 Gp37-like protein